MSLFGAGTDLTLGRGRGSYANPHATIAIRDIPTNIKQVFRLTRFYYHQDALLGAIIDKMSEYPITQLIVTEKGGAPLSDKSRDRWDYLLNVALNVRGVMRTINVDKYVFGQSFHYLYYPFIRYCRSLRGGREFPISSIKDLRAIPDTNNGRFTLRVFGRAPDDGFRRESEFRVIDRKSEARVGINLTRLNPVRMELEYNPTSGRKDWYWTPPRRLRDGLTDGVRGIIETTEMRILEAAFKEKKVLLNPDRLWVAQADEMPGLWEGWGIPPTFRVLEDVYYLKILRRANEALAQEHVTPLRVLSPSGTGDISPQRTMNLSDWQNRVRREIQRFRQDPNHVMLSPVPLNIEQMGGQARVMMVASEMEAAARTIAAGIGCPIEMIWGGLNWSGASVSLRVLENHFLNDRENAEQLLSFLVPKLATYFRLPRVRVELAEFKMADDVQQQSNAINLMLQGFLSRESVINEMGYESAEEFRRLEGEHEKLNNITAQDNLAASHMNTVIQALEAKAQILLKYEMQLVEQGIAARHERQRIQNVAAFAAEIREQGLVTPLEFEHAATLLQRMPPQIQQGVFQQWSQTMPFVTQLLMEKMSYTEAVSGQAEMDAQGGMDPGGGAQSFGAAAGAGLDPGATGPYGQDARNETVGGSDGIVDEDDALPEQNPPRRQESPV